MLGFTFCNPNSVILDWLFLISSHSAPHTHICAVVKESGMTLLPQKEHTFNFSLNISLYWKRRLTCSVFFSFDKGETKGWKEQVSKGWEATGTILGLLVCGTGMSIFYVLSKIDFWFNVTIEEVQRSTAGFILGSYSFSVWISRAAKWQAHCVFLDVLLLEGALMGFCLSCFVKLCGWHLNSENKIFPAKAVTGNYNLKRSFLFIFISVILKKASQRELWKFVYVH